MPRKSSAKLTDKAMNNDDQQPPSTDANIVSDAPNAVIDVDNTAPPTDRNGTTRSGAVYINRPSAINSNAHESVSSELSNDPPAADAADTSITRKSVDAPEISEQFRINRSKSRGGSVTSWKASSSRGGSQGHYVPSIVGSIRSKIPSNFSETSSVSNTSLKYSKLPKASATKLYQLPKDPFKSVYRNDNDSVQDDNSWDSYDVKVNENGDVEGIPPGLVNNETLNQNEMEQVKRNELKKRIKMTEREIALIKTTSIQLQKGQADLHQGQSDLKIAMDSILELLTKMKPGDASVVSIPTSSRPVFEQINVPIQEHTYQGREMVTCGVIFKEGSKVFWKYGNDLMRDVTIVEVVRAKKATYPSYHVEFGHGESHLVRHDELYIPIDSNPMINPEGVIHATEEPIPVAAQLHMSVMKEKNPRLIKMYDAMNDEKFKLDTLVSSLKELALADDKLITLKQFYGAVVMGTLAASKGALQIPNLDQLSPNVTIKQIMMPPSDYPMRTRAIAFYGNFAQAIQNVVLNPSFSKDAPIAKRHINTVRFNKDGIEILYYLLSKRFPYLGALDFDPHAAIKSTVVDDGMQLSDFLSQVQETQMQLELSKADVSPNALLKQLFDQLFKTNLAPLITDQRHKFNSFLRRNPNGVIYPNESVESVLEYLLEGQSLTTIKLIDSSASAPLTESALNVPEGYRKAVSQHKKYSNFSKPTYAAIKTTGEVQEDDASIENYTNEDKEEVERIIKPAYAALKTDNDTVNDSIYQELFYNAMRRHKEKPQCEACLGTHPTDECWARGPNFQDEALRRRVQQVNAKYGDAPTNPPKPKTPPKATFDAHLKQKSMSIKLQPEASGLKDLQYRSITDVANIETVLNEIAHDMESAVENDELTVDPKLAVINLGANAHANANAVPSDRSLADALQVGDYSVYNEQVNC